MKLSSPITITTDVLIIGGGGAGLRAAIEARSHGVNVLVVSRSRVGYGSNTTISGGAFAATIGPSYNNQDLLGSCDQHLRDTVTGGYFLSDQALVEVMVRSAEQQVDDLQQFGVRYTNKQSSPWITLSTDPGHSRMRMVYGQNAFGTDFTLPLRLHALKQGTEFLEGILITNLLHKGENIVGATGIDTKGQIFIFSASAVVLTSGGLGKIYLRNDNAAGSTGDGYAIAYESGAVLQDMEFVQYYPVSLGAGTPAIFYECLLLETRGKLLNRNGEDIITKYNLADPMLLTRDRLSRAIALEIAKGLGFEGKVVLDLSEIKKNKMELLKLLLPKLALKGGRRFLIAPTVHFHMGGVKINERTETSISGLYAAGEVCAGIHGANRLSGNALTEVWVFGTIAGREAARRAKEIEAISLPTDVIADTVSKLQELTSKQDGERPELLHQHLKDIMWQKAGIIRNAEELKQALDKINSLRESYQRVFVQGVKDLQLALQLRNMLIASEMICRAALFRSESRGAHYRQDFPETNNDDWLCNILLTKKDECMELTTQPVKLSKLSPPA
jgi:succinate dehydrogenase/fumarate reductase flavoprotein subunit